MSEIIDQDDPLIFRMHVVINGKRTTISLDPVMFRALSMKLGSAAAAREWINKRVSNMVKVNKTISRQVQSLISMTLLGQSTHAEEQVEPKNTQTVIRPPSTQPSNFKSDELPL